MFTFQTLLKMSTVAFFNDIIDVPEKNREIPVKSQFLLGKGDRPRTTRLWLLFPHPPRSATSIYGAVVSRKYGRGLSLPRSERA